MEVGQANAACKLGLFCQMFKKFPAGRTSQLVEGDGVLLGVAVGESVEVRVGGCWEGVALATGAGEEVTVGANGVKLGWGLETCGVSVGTAVVGGRMGVSVGAGGWGLRARRPD